MPLRIEDYAMIGDCQTAALVGNNGSIDWLCLPRFDSGACFAALLGNEENGRWQIAPRGTVRRVRRRYRPGTLILETEFETDEGAVRLTDCMPPRGESPDLLRLVTGIHGSVAMRCELVIRFDYGWIVPWVRKRADGLRAVAGPDSLILRSPVPLHGENFHSVGEFQVDQGQQVPFCLTWHPSHEPAPPFLDPAGEVRAAEEWWQAWAARCTYQGPWRAEVLNSLVVLKAMTYLPTGGLVAAVTTSLPEQLGGPRNWDYRFCWLRDAAMTLYSLLVGGYQEEARAWRDWLLRAVAGRPAEMQIMYGLGGERRLDEWEVPWLAGYEGAKPVRIGNAAAQQLQLDVYGEVMDALHVARNTGLPADDNAWRVQGNLLEFLESNWQQHDYSIWEVRGKARPFVYSKIMAWVAFDRAVQTVERWGADGPVDRWRALRDAVHREVCQQGFNARLNSFVQYYGAEHPDAALLNIPLVGFLDANDPRMLGTVAAIQRELMVDGFVQRYPAVPEVDGLPAGEGAFLACTFWYLDNLALQGRLDEARRGFQRMLELANDVGLLAEEYDPHAGRLVGNFPQAFSHIGLINTARNLAQAGGPAEKHARGEPV